MTPALDTPTAVKVATSGTAAALITNLDNTQAPGNALYALGCNQDCWFAQGIADTTFTVDHTTSIFTATGHRLQIGMPVQVSNSGGALPTGMAASTYYWSRRIDDNTFYLYDTRAHALAGGATGKIAPSTNGTGTQTMTTIASAGAGSMLLPAGAVIVLDGRVGAKVSVIQDSAAGTVCITRVLGVR